MGCLNSTGRFAHWFGNIHLSGPCNRKCYFCIGQHMMALDELNTLHTWPLPGIVEFVNECWMHPIKAFYLTGTNTDPALYRNPSALKIFLGKRFSGIPLGIRTNGVMPDSPVLKHVDMGSLTICSLNERINVQMMGGKPPDLEKFLVATSHWWDLKVNIVLGPENMLNDWRQTIMRLRDYGIKRVNLREPYGQPHIGDPIDRLSFTRTLGMPTYDIGGVEVTYWDVHYVEVESVNLYASGRVSVDYPISRGHAPTGEVHPQEHWKLSGRHTLQWVKSSSLPA